MSASCISVSEAMSRALLALDTITAPLSGNAVKPGVLGALLYGNRGMGQTTSATLARLVSAGFAIRERNGNVHRYRVSAAGRLEARRRRTEFVRREA
jgi:DNA-binding transcriptional regulator PaaX